MSQLVQPGPVSTRSAAPAGALPRQASRADHALEPSGDEQVPPVAGVVPFRVARVNLLPPEIEQARALRRTKGVLAGGLVAVVAVLGAGYAHEVHARQAAERRLVDVQAQTTVLQRDQAQYADVPTTVAAIDAAQAARETAMANDVEWARTLTDFSLSLPERVRFTSLTLSVGSGSGASGGSAAAPTPATGAGAAAAAAGGIGSVAVEGTAGTNRDVASWLDTLAQRPGMTNAYFSSAEQQQVGSQSIVKFSSTATLTSDALSHRYDRKQG